MIPLFLVGQMPKKMLISLIFDGILSGACSEPHIIQCRPANRSCEFTNYQNMLFRICGNDELLYEDFSMADVDLSIENYEELFGVSQNHSE